ncbi:MmcQ/YjbR family DNA-binding protein [Spongiactinospora sp. TRM90649]|uniref:MmcQ/YjbR family DNA-binding protein n=1 Tax=Spongiactinospora sp. TRM90649 TaxID=3031114 RepID=UPI0023F9346D|nr:MmcQ/YjbR family DNA-binding protein [Spongiactinospora sp. TRM90649]MDF5754650.1 MmcQ/YjbR family DNA-binding protein [Spongiactinospora sp. TRM90649]
MGVSVDEFLAMVERLPEVTLADGGEWTSVKVTDRGFCFLWEKTETVGVKATITEQLALVAERPDVFEVQFTAGQFGWVVVHLPKITLTELSELVTEAWCLTAPQRLLDAHESRLVAEVTSATAAPIPP